jgi:tyrosine-protein kinase Etk/Wzc
MMDSIDNSVSQSNDNLLYYLIIIAKYSRMIVFSAIIVTVLSYLYLFILPNKYTSTLRLLPPQQNITMSRQLLDIMSGGPLLEGTDTGSALGGMPAGLFGLKTPSDLYVAMMHSDTVSDRIIERFNLRELYQGKYIDDVRKALWKNVKMTVGKKDGIINIEVTDRTPMRSAAIGNALVEELEKLLKELSLKEAQNRLAFLEKERVQALQNLTKAEDTLRTFSEEKNVVQLDTQTRGTLEYIARLRGEIDAKEVQVQVLRQRATSYNYDVILLETELKSLKDKLRGAETQMDQVCEDDVCLSSSKVPALGLEYMRLVRETKFQNSLYQLFTKMGEIARLDMVKDVAVIRVLDQGKPPESRSNKRLRPALITGFITFVMMIFFAFGFERWQNERKSEKYSNSIALITTYLKPWIGFPMEIFSKLRRK